MRPWSCERWGTIGGPDNDDPSCTCCMCRARRFDRLTPKQRKLKGNLDKRPVVPTWTPSAAQRSKNSPEPA